MSSPVSSVIQNIRALLNDQTGSRFQRTNEQMRAIINTNMQGMAFDIYDGLTKQTAAATLVPGTDTYTLIPSATTLIQKVVGVIRHSDNWPMLEIPIAVMLEFKRNTGSSSSGPPTRFTLYEDTTDLLKIILYPTPGAADTLDIWYAPIPADLSLDTDTIPFSAVALRALEKMCAADVLMGMTPEERDKCRLSPEIIGLWKEDARKMLDREQSRTGNLVRSGGILRTYR